MENENTPERCDSTLSVIKVQPVGANKKRSLSFVSQKFNDPEIEELYQLHSANQKRTELFRCFLYAILFYSFVHLVVYIVWIPSHSISFSNEMVEMDLEIPPYKAMHSRQWRGNHF